MAFKQRAGLQDTRYDAALIDAVRDRLGLPESPSLEDQLAAKSVEIAPLLSAMLRALEPYSRLMTDLLAFYEHVSQRSNGK